ncbi:hypothetical protein SAMN05216326_12511 [Nitrosomonas marina]|uniref:Uncharacterized protein n=1 Tax=Nitrosomonas marina TaxID=917 RepID=A0A1I0E6Z1_9PROT|nr:hypothetical protein [Nitrosomonas marina]SET40195.1 hypothetical protein SAMN05216326_12511 [Nitrosomonas marina]
MRLDQLNLVQRQHLAWRLDHKTACGMLTACQIARLGTEFDSKQVFEVFIWAGKSERSAKIHAGKVERFTLR